RQGPSPRSETPLRGDRYVWMVWTVWFSTCPKMRFSRGIEHMFPPASDSSLCTDRPLGATTSRRNSHSVEKRVEHFPQAVHRNRRGPHGQRSTACGRSAV